jgi:hypothetical protein
MTKSYIKTMPNFPPSRPDVIVQVQLTAIEHDQLQALADALMLKRPNTHISVGAILHKLAKAHILLTHVLP